MKRIWGIRHFRYIWHAFWLDIHVRNCAAMGFGWHANQSDIDYLDAIWRGEK
jgi:hypothetical protein